MNSTNLILFLYNLRPLVALLALCNSDTEAAQKTQQQTLPLSPSCPPCTRGSVSVAHVVAQLHRTSCPLCRTFSTAEVRRQPPRLLAAAAKKQKRRERERDRPLIARMSEQQKHKLTANSFNMAGLNANLPDSGLSCLSGCTCGPQPKTLSSLFSSPFLIVLCAGLTDADRSAMALSLEVRASIPAPLSL